MRPVSSHGPSILLVEDDADVLSSIEDVLQAALGQPRILSAGTAEEGLALLGQNRVDLVVSDYKLPGMDGLRFLQEAVRLAPQAPRILITAFIELPVTVESVNAARLDAVIAKPLDVDILLDQVLAALAPTAEVRATRAGQASMQASAAPGRHVRMVTPRPSSDPRQATDPTMDPGGPAGRNVRDA